MSQVVLRQGWAKNLDGSVALKAIEFTEKIMRDDTSPGLHIEPILNSVDRRVRTGRVDRFWRAVMVKVPSDPSTLYYMYGIFPHDEAIERAKKLTLAVNAVNGDVVYRENEHREFTPVVSPVVVVKEEETFPLLTTWSHTTEKLVAELGFEMDVAERAMSLHTEDEIIQLAGLISGLESQMLLELATGTPISEIRKIFELDEASEFLEQLKEDSTEAEVDLSADEVIVKATKREAAKANFIIVEGEDELREVIEAGDFGAWRVFLHPSQRRYAYGDYNGSFRLSGGAGTGKTVVLLHRTRELQRKNPAARLVLTTYNKTLAESLKDNMELLDPTASFANEPGQEGILVTGIDALAGRVLRQAPKDVVDEVAVSVLGREVNRTFQSPKNTLWESALDVMGAVTDERVRNAVFLQQEYENVVLPRGITTREEYRKVRRPGRGVALDRSRRDAVWLAIEKYRLLAGEAPSFAERCALAAGYLRRATAEGTATIADHVLIDEGQDFSATHWMLVRELVEAGPNDVFIAEDGNQRIYAQRIILSHFGFGVRGRSRRLTLNYRTTQQNLRYAVKVLEGGEFLDLGGQEASTDKFVSARFGPEPQVIEASHLGDAVSKTVEQIAQWRKQDEDEFRTIAVLIARKSQADAIERELNGQGIAARFIEDSARTDAGTVQIMTMHRAKGMEFSRVIIFDQETLLNESALSQRGRSDTEVDEELLRNRALVYVASTRARDELVVVNR